MLPEHVGAEIGHDACPPLGSDNGQEVPAGAEPGPDAREQCPLVGERHVDQRIERRHGLDGREPQAEVGHVGPGRTPLLRTARSWLRVMDVVWLP